MEYEWGQRCYLRDTIADETDAQDQLLDAEIEKTFVCSSWKDYTHTRTLSLARVVCKGNHSSL